MKKVTMVEYQGRCDTGGKAVGHAPKVLIEYYDFIKDIADVEIFAPRGILQELPKEISRKSKALPKHILMKGHNSLFEKIANKKVMFDNLRIAFRRSDADIIWLFNVEYYVMLYLFLHKKPKAKLVCTLFLEQFSGNGMVGKIKSFVFSKARAKMDLIISAGEDFNFPECETVFIPDYYDQPEKMGAYRKLAKKEQAVCLGTMGNGKQLEEMVEAFNRIGYPLIVAGRFYDNERFAKLKEMANANITLANKYLSDSEYLELLASSKYTVLPYSPSQYRKQTSGVLQEAVFLNTVPVTYQDILEGNHVQGIGFASWDELCIEQLTGNTKEYENSYEVLRNTRYHRDCIAKAYESVFS